MNNKEYFKALDERELKLLKRLNYIFETSKSKYKQELVEIAKKDADFLEKVLNNRVEGHDFGAIKSQMFREIDELNVIAYKSIAEYYYKLAIKQLENNVDIQVKDKYNEKTFNEVLNKFIVAKGINYSYKPELERRLDYFDNQMVNANLAHIYSKMPNEPKKSDVLRVIEGFNANNTQVRDTLRTQKHQFGNFIDNVAVSVAVSSALKAYEDNNIEKVLWIAEQDERTCEICNGYHGKVFDIDKVPDIPVHANCRCHLEPYKRKK